MSDDGAFVTMLAIIGIFVIIIMCIVHAFNPKTDFTNQCIRHHGIPDTHQQQWVCVGASKDESQ